MSRVEIVEKSRDIDETNRTGTSFRSTNPLPRKPIVHCIEDEEGRPKVVVECGAWMPEGALWKYANAKMDEYLLNRRAKALEQDAHHGQAVREKKRAAGVASGAKRRKQNQPLAEAVEKLRDADRGISIAELAAKLHARYTRPSDDPVKARRALAKRISRLDNPAK